MSDIKIPSVLHNRQLRILFGLCVAASILSLSMFVLLDSEIHHHQNQDHVTLAPPRQTTTVTTRATTTTTTKPTTTTTTTKPTTTTTTTKPTTTKQTTTSTTTKLTTTTSIPTITTTSKPPPSTTATTISIAKPISWLDDLNEITETTVADRVLNRTIARAMRQFKRSPFYTIKEDWREITCTLLLVASQNCDPVVETLANCVTRLGMKNLEKILSDRCTKSSFWREILPKLLNGGKNGVVENGGDDWKKLKRGLIWDSAIQNETEGPSRVPYIPPEQRDISPFPPPRVCKNGCKHFPFGFGLPLSAFEKSVRRTKNFAWMPLVPRKYGSMDGYEATIADEDFFHEMYAQSFFAWGHIRGGCGCMRELEVISAGAIPFYWDLDRVPTNTMGHFPKDLMRQAMQMPGVDHHRRINVDSPESYVRRILPDNRVNFARLGEIESSKFNLTQYFDFADQILAHGRKYMTTRAIVAYMLKCMNAENARTALIFTRNTNDYIENTVIHGLQDLGIDVTVISSQKNYDFYYPRVTADGKMTRQERDGWLLPQQNFTYGSAFGFGGRYSEWRVRRPWVVNPRYVLSDIKAKKFDVAFWQLDNVNSSYIVDFVEPAKEAGTKLGFLQYRDFHGDPGVETMLACQFGGTIFVREMSDAQC